MTYWIKRVVPKILLVLVIVASIGIIISSSWPNARSVDVINFPAIFLSEMSISSN